VEVRSDACVCGRFLFLGSPWSALLPCGRLCRGRYDNIGHDRLNEQVRLMTKWQEKTRTRTQRTTSATPYASERSAEGRIVTSLATSSLGVPCLFRRDNCPEIAPRTSRSPGVEITELDFLTCRAVGRGFAARLWCFLEAFSLSFVPLALPPCSFISFPNLEARVWRERLSSSTLATDETSKFGWVLVLAV
jgi:hypothetical protein